MSEQQGCTEVNYSRSLMFHGLGREYFRLCIVNLLLIIVTLGVFAPWAFVRSKQYLYNHTELSGSRFSYNATGGSIFVSWVFLGVFLLSLYMSIYHHASALSWCLVALIVLFLPWLMMRSIRYQMQSTMLNNVRFNFKCSGLKAWWVVLGCPVLLFSAVYFIIQLVINSLLTVCTLGLGYPWARVRYCRYLANNTWLDRDLDTLDLQDHDDKIATDIVSRISCGIVPNISL